MSESVLLKLCNSVILVCQVLECFELYQDSNIFHQLIPLFPKVFVLLEPVSNNSSLIIYACFQFFYHILHDLINAVFFQYLTISSIQSHAAQILGFKFQYYQRLDVNSTVPSGLFRTAALLIKSGFIDLDNVYVS